MKICCYPFFFLATTLALMSYETAPFELIEEEGAFSIRHYPSLLLVETPMGEGASSDNSFGRLFRYISGSNSGSTKIAMTTPVFMDNETMQFVLPVSFMEEGAPAPRDAAVSLRESVPMTVGVYRFSGWRNDRNEERAWGRLQDILREKGVDHNDSPFFAYYNSPWIPGPLRRNEVMVRIKLP
jgi:hypothetical protein